MPNIVYGFKETAEDQPAYARWHRQPEPVPVVVDARGPGAPAQRWWGGLTPDEVFEHGRDLMWPRVPVMPASTSQPVLSGTAEIGSVLRVTAGTWERVEVITYQWVRDGRPITHATGSTYTVGLDDAGAVLACVVTGTNTAGSTSQISGASDPVPIPVPVNLEAPIVVATGLGLGALLTSTTGVWTGTTTHFSFQWLRNDVPIQGAVGPEYVLSTGDHSTMITCIVTASTAGGSTAATSNAVGPAVTSGPPELQAPPEITPSQGLHIGSELHVSTGSWSGEPYTYTFQWLASGNPIVGAITDIYTLTTADANSAISCAVTATNGAGSVTAVSAPVGPVSSSNPLQWHTQVMTWHGQQMTWN